MVKLREITAVLEAEAPPGFQESYDNSGLQVGDPDMEVNGVLISLDVTEAVLEEAVRLGYNLVVSHHPVIFGGIKSLTGKSPAERIVAMAIKNDLAIYSGHTNFDAVDSGVNARMAARLGLTETRILDPLKGQLKKLVVFVPHDHLEPVRSAIFAAGAGHIGDYDCCAFATEGKGSFRGLEGSDPFVGEKGSLHEEPEIRLETVLPAHRTAKVVRAMVQAHPYEEVAYDLYPIENTYERAGSGMIGELEHSMEEEMFLNFLKDRFNLSLIRHSPLLGKPVRKVALCGGAGSFLLGRAIRSGADVFVTGDMKYHQFFEADGRIVVMDIGHYESEQFTRELFYDLITKKFPKFAVRISETVTNPIKYY